ncbi:MAG: ABC transporter permease, partial [Longimicrobiales bacterium]
MSMLSDVRTRLGSLLSRGREEREMEEELDFHRALDVQRNLDRGMSAVEAARSATHRFGNADRTREEVRDARGVRPLDDLRSDIRLAVRGLVRAPSFSVVVLATLALGIGATAAIFTVIDGVLLRPAPYAALDELVVVWETDRASGTTREPGSYPDFVDFQDRSRTLAGISAFQGANVDYLPEGGGDPARISVISATSTFPSLLGIEPLVGRTFTRAEDQPGGERVVMLGESFWRARFDGDRAIVGRTIRLNDVPHTVVGVMPASAGFGVPQIHALADYHAPYSGSESIDAWLPLRTDAAITPRDTHPFLLLGRLAAGVIAVQAQQELGAIAAELEASYPENADRGVSIEPLRAVVFDGVRPALLILGGAVAFVLLIACANVTSLLLARSRVRTREVAVRTALGASAGRLARQFLAENLVLALLGAAAGLVLARVGLDVLLRLVPADVPRAASLGLDLRVLALAAALSLVVGALFALVPLLHSRRTPVHATLREEAGRTATSGRDGTRFRSALVVMELALSVILATGAVLLIRSFDRLRSVDPGFSAQGVLKVEYQLPAARYPRDFAVWPNWHEVHAFNAGVLARVRALPGVSAAAISEAHPLDPGFTNSFAIVGREAESRDFPEITIRKVSPGYFETGLLPVLRGRAFHAGDASDSDLVLLINATAAERFFA